MPKYTPEQWRAWLSDTGQSTATSKEPIDRKKLMARLVQNIAKSQDRYEALEKAMAARGMDPDSDDPRVRDAFDAFAAKEEERSLEDFTPEEFDVIDLVQREKSWGLSGEGDDSLGEHEHFYDAGDGRLTRAVTKAEMPGMFPPKYAPEASPVAPPRRAAPKEGALRALRVQVAKDLQAQRAATPVDPKLQEAADLLTKNAGRATPWWAPPLVDPADSVDLPEEAGRRTVAPARKRSY